MEKYLHADITGKIIEQAYYVHKVLGAGFLEKVYENALCKKIRDAGLKCEQQQPIKVYFENEIVGDYVADLIVEDKVIVELKAIEKVQAIHEVQLINYLKATKIEVGLLINFGRSCQIKRKIYSL